jgi:tripeptidyl-peptidase-1
MQTIGMGHRCLSNDGTNTTKFEPQFPASCPYVTSVGGTRFVEPEVATSFSSGGFSDYWPTPWYQNDTINAYLKALGSQNAGYFNKSGRGQSPYVMKK